MSKKPALVIMAAGMGSRYGGLKQLDPLNEYGELIIDFSIFDALRAGFEKIVFVIKHEIEDIFKEKIGHRIEKYADVSYVYQQLDKLPEGYSIPEGREKPWGTGHAILCCKDVVDGPFAVVNADDYYGVEAFKKIYDYLTTHEDDELYRYAMVGYLVENTLTDFGYVSRGVCSVDENHMLTDIHERTHIEKKDGAAFYTEDNGETWVQIPAGNLVSMNLWGFTENFIGELEKRFENFLDKALVENPLKGEYFLPFVVDELIKENKATAEVLKSEDRWYGVTYKEDKEVVVNAINEMKKTGKYPQKLWD